LPPRHRRPPPPPLFPYTTLFRSHFGRAVERTVDSFLENAYNIDRKLLLERNRVTRLQGGPYREVTLYEAVRPVRAAFFNAGSYRSEEHTSELQSRSDLVCRLLLE